MASPVRVGLGPQVCHELLPTHAAASRLDGCEDREERESPPLHSSARERAGRPFDGRPA